MIEFTSIVALVLVLTQVIKKAFAIKKNVVPFMSVVIGFVVVGLYAIISKDGVLTTESFFQTIIAIATANGIYAGGSATLKG